MDIKEKILAQSTDLFLRYGIRSVTMDTIAKELGISKKTIYQYFKDKNEIVETITRLYLENEKALFCKIKQSSNDSIEELVNVTRCLRETMANMNPSLLYDLKKYHYKAWNMFLEYKENVFKESIKSSIQKGIEEGNFRPEINPDIIAIMRFEQVQMAFDSDIFPVNRFDFREVQMQLFMHFVFGIVTEKGKEKYIKYLHENQLVHN